jgi:hypothetical protein
MKRSTAVKFPNSVQLFKFCQKVMMHQKGTKVRDQEVGAILNFNPSDCSHWKRGEKNVRSVFSLAKLAETLSVETSLIHDVSSGAVNLEEAYFEYQESHAFKSIYTKGIEEDFEAFQTVRTRAISFAEAIQEQVEFKTPPLYLPEVMRAFAFISSQPVEMLDRLSRILRTKPGRYSIQFKKGDLKPQTRMSMVKDLSRIIFEAERARFPELGEADSKFFAIEELIFTANLLSPRSVLLNEMSRLDARKNVISELASIFWVPKSLIGFQLQDIIRDRASIKTESVGATAIENDSTTTIF